MKQVLFILPSVFILGLVTYRQFYLKPEIDTFKLLDLPWPTYCDFYKNEEDRISGQAVFAFPSASVGQTYVAKIDGEMQNFAHLIERGIDRQMEWLTYGDNGYVISFDITDHSEVEEIQNYSGSMSVRRNGASKTIPVIGGCGA